MDLQTDFAKLFFRAMDTCSVIHKSYDPCLHEKYIDAGVMTFVTHCTFLYGVCCWVLGSILLLIGLL